MRAATNLLLAGALCFAMTGVADAKKAKEYKATNDAVVGACGDVYKKCYGDAVDKGTFAGPCKDYGECVAACGEGDTACVVLMVSRCTASHEARGEVRFPRQARRLFCQRLGRLGGPPGFAELKEGLRQVAIIVTECGQVIRIGAVFLARFLQMADRLLKMIAGLLSLRLEVEDHAEVATRPAEVGVPGRRSVRLADQFR